MPKALPTGWHFGRPEIAAHYLRTFDLGLISAVALHADAAWERPNFSPET